MCIKSEADEILFKLATNDHSEEAFLSAPAQGLCLNFYSSITTDLNSTQVSDTGPMVLWLKRG